MESEDAFIENLGTSASGDITSGQSTEENLAFTTDHLILATHAQGTADSTDFFFHSFILKHADDAAFL